MTQTLLSGLAADGSLSNRRVWADLTGDGICMDDEGAVWTSGVSEDGKNACLRVREGGEVLQRVDLERSCFSCMPAAPTARRST